MQPFRNVLRWIFLALVLAFAAWTAPEMIHNFREWRSAAPGDPVAAEFWRSVFYMDLTEIAIVLGIGIIMWILLRPRRRVAARNMQL